MIRGMGVSEPAPIGDSRDTELNKTNNLAVLEHCAKTVLGN